MHHVIPVTPAIESNLWAATSLMDAVVADVSWLTRKLSLIPLWCKSTGICCVYSIDRRIARCNATVNYISCSAAESLDSQITFKTVCRWHNFVWNSLAHFNVRLLGICKRRSSIRHQIGVDSLRSWQGRVLKVMTSAPPHFVYLRLRHYELPSFQSSAKLSARRSFDLMYRRLYSVFQVTDGLRVQTWQLDTRGQWLIRYSWLNGRHQCSPPTIAPSARQRNSTGLRNIANLRRQCKQYARETLTFFLPLALIFEMIFNNQKHVLLCARDATRRNFQSGCWDCVTTAQRVAWRRDCDRWQSGRYKLTVALCTTVLGQFGINSLMAPSPIYSQ